MTPKEPLVPGSDGVTDEAIRRRQKSRAIVMALAIGALFVSSMLSRSVVERRLEFATLKAIGIPSLTILLVVAAEAVLVSGPGSVVLFTRTWTEIRAEDPGVIRPRSQVAGAPMVQVPWVGLTSRTVTPLGSSSRRATPRASDAPPLATVIV